MLQIRNISKSYVAGDFRQVALDNVSLNFRENEFVAILGQSGSGKTTLLNVLGGLDQYDSGDLIINGKSTKQFKDRDWDAYRNNSVGFIFQSYNLISHLSLVDNVELSMTLSGVSGKEKHRRALEALTKVGLKDHIHKKPGQLSGGQMQRVAIARALSNNPDVILADEPTGALDTETSEQVMELIKQIARDKLVVMVTHNSDLAQRYSNRIVRLSDGKVISDSNPIDTTEISENYTLKKTSMGLLTALKLSGQNILTKKGRTALTAFASSIGIIGIALVLALSNGFNKQIGNYESSALSNYPITISKTATNISRPSSSTQKNSSVKFPGTKYIYSYDSAKNTASHTNTITKPYLAYIRKIDPALLDAVGYTYSVNMNILEEKDGKAVAVDTAKLNWDSYPGKLSTADGDYLNEYYDVLAGSLPKGRTDLVLVTDEYDRLDTSMLKELGISSTDGEGIDFSKIVGKKFKLIRNDEYYKKSGNLYTVNGDPSNLAGLYNSGSATALRIAGIIRIKQDTKASSLSSGVYYSEALAQYFIGDAENSNVVKAQKNADYNVLTGGQLADSSGTAAAGAAGGQGFGAMGSGSSSLSGQGAATKDSVLESLGSTDIPASISLYPRNFDDKEKITAYLDQWNAGRSTADKIEYTDLAALVTNLSSSIMSAITLVLIAFAAISLIVSMIMIGIIIYISVLERTKEIGVLRALGARKKDISRVFNAETFIIGACSGLMGIGITYLLEIPANAILYNLTKLKNVAQLNPLHATALVLISIVLTLVGGFIPAKWAAKKDPVEALRTE